MIRDFRIHMALVILAILATTAGQARADVAQYRFSGILPSDVTISGDMIGKVAAGESWTALVNVELTTPDSEAATDFGIYFSASLDANLEFSGGYSSSLVDPFVYSDIYVLNGAFGVDGVLADMAELTGSEALYVGVTNDDLTTIASDALPLFPTSFNQGVALSDLVLSYVSPGGGIIEYSSNNNGTFEVVPEPSMIMLWSILGVAGLGFGYRRKRKAA